MALYFDDFLDEDEQDEEKEGTSTILVDLRKIVEEMDDVESVYEDEEDEEGDLYFQKVYPLLMDICICRGNLLVWGKLVYADVECRDVDVVLAAHSADLLSP